MEKIELMAKVSELVKEINRTHDEFKALPWQKRTRASEQGIAYSEANENLKKYLLSLGKDDVDTLLHENFGIGAGAGAFKEYIGIAAQRIRANEIEKSFTRETWKIIDNINMYLVRDTRDGLEKLTDKELDDLLVWLKFNNMRCGEVYDEQKERKQKKIMMEKCNKCMVVPDPTKTCRIKKFNPFPLASSDPLQPVLSGVFNDSSFHDGVGVVTDGFIMLVSGKLYDEHNAGKVLDKNGEVITDGNGTPLKYRPWQSIQYNLPNRYKGMVTKIASVAQQICDMAKADLAGCGLKAKAKREYKGKQVVALRFSEDTILYMSYQIFKKFVDACLFIGAEDVMYKDENNALKAVTGGADFVLAMPRRSGNIVACIDLTK